MSYVNIKMPEHIYDNKLKLTWKGLMDKETFVKFFSEQVENNKIYTIDKLKNELNTLIDAFKLFNNNALTAKQLYNDYWAPFQKEILLQKETALVTVSGLTKSSFNDILMINDQTKAFSYGADETAKTITLVRKAEQQWVSLIKRGSSKQLIQSHWAGLVKTVNSRVSEEDWTEYKQIAEANPKYANQVKRKDGTYHKTLIGRINKTYYSVHDGDDRPQYNNYKWITYGDRKQQQYLGQLFESFFYHMSKHHANLANTANFSFNSTTIHQSVHKEEGSNFVYLLLRGNNRDNWATGGDVQVGFNNKDFLDAQLKTSKENDPTFGTLSWQNLSNTLQSIQKQLNSINNNKILKQLGEEIFDHFATSDLGTLNMQKLLTEKKI